MRELKARHPSRKISRQAEPATPLPPPLPLPPGLHRLEKDIEDKRQRPIPPSHQIQPARTTARHSSSPLLFLRRFARKRRLGTAKPREHHFLPPFPPFFRREAVERRVTAHLSFPSSLFPANPHLKEMEREIASVSLSTLPHLQVTCMSGDPRGHDTDICFSPFFFSFFFFYGDVLKQDKDLREQKRNFLAVVFSPCCTRG